MPIIEPTHPFSMSSFPPSTLPIIDIAPLLDSGHRDAELRASTSAALHDACVQYGFFYLNISAYVNPSEPEQLAELARSFFSLPQEEKDKLALKNEDNTRGLIYLYPTTRMSML
jgi:isopenicillin N synthase-like dioxygenase